MNMKAKQERFVDALNAKAMEYAEQYSGLNPDVASIVIIEGAKMALAEMQQLLRERLQESGAKPCNPDFLTVL